MGHSSLVALRCGSFLRFLRSLLHCRRLDTALQQFLMDLVESEELMANHPWFFGVFLSMVFPYKQRVEWYGYKVVMNWLVMSKIYCHQHQHPSTKSRLGVTTRFSLLVTRNHCNQRSEPIITIGIVIIPSGGQFSFFISPGVQCFNALPHICKKTSCMQGSTSIMK